MAAQIKYAALYIDGGMQSFIDVDDNGKQTGNVTVGISSWRSGFSDCTMLTRCRYTPDYCRLKQTFRLEKQCVDHGLSETWVGKVLTSSLSFRH